MKKILKSAIVGCGGVAQVHADALRGIDGTVLTACADTKPERASALAEKHGANSYSGLEEMLENETIDALHICTPHYLHIPMALKAHEKNIHVFLEKPPVISREELAILDKSFRGGAGLGICFQNRFNGATAHMRDALESKKYGKILGARAFVTWERDEKYYTESGWRGSLTTEGGGVLINQSIHTLDLLVHLLGKPASVEASCSNRHLKGAIQVEDTVEAYIDFGHVKALFYATTAFCTDSPVFIEAVCENGAVRIEGTTLIEYPKDGLPLYFYYSKSVLGKGYWGSGHADCIQSFYESLETGGDFPIGVSAVLSTMDLMLGIYESSARGQPVMLGGKS